MEPSFNFLPNKTFSNAELQEKPLEKLHGGVVVIGNFDGVHKGHQIVLRTAVGIAEQAGEDKNPFVMTFEPHPRTVFNPSEPVFRLTSIATKERLFGALGLQGTVVVPFDTKFASMEPDDFVVRLLVDHLKVSHCVVGYDFHFGKNRKGSPEFLIQQGKEYGFGVSVVPAQRDATGELTYSSSQVRTFLSRGEIEKANSILGYSYFVSGEVIHGEKRGRDLGYPTANLRLEDNNELSYGIYAVRLRIDGAMHEGVASFGRRPTFDNGAPLLETFIFDFDEDLYGKTIEVVLVKYLRGEEKFDGIEPLTEQMNKDSSNAREALANEAPISDIDRFLNEY